MANTLNIPSITLKPGTHVFGPDTPPSGISTVTITFSRTDGSHSLNTAAPTTTFAAELEISYDGGTTWETLGGAETTGGSSTDPDTGQPYATFYLEVDFPSPTTAATQVRGTITVTGATVSVSGSIAES